MTDDGEKVAFERLVVVVCEPAKPPKVRSADGDKLAAMQRFVGGYIERIGGTMFCDPIVIEAYVNEDGRMTGLQPNRLVRIGSVTAATLGPVVLVAANRKTGETVSLDAVPGLLDAATKLAASWPVSLESLIPEIG